MTSYPRFLLTFSKNKYNNTKFCNEEFLRVYYKSSLMMAKGIFQCHRTLLKIEQLLNLLIQYFGFEFGIFIHREKNLLHLLIP